MPDSDEATPTGHPTEGPESDNRPHVDPATTPIRVRRDWDAALERTEHLRPAGCHAALLDWQPERWPDESGMPVEIALALGTALTGLGAVLGRADGQSRAGPTTTLIPPPHRSAFRGLHDRFLRRRAAEPVVRTRDPAEVAALLDAEWSFQVQAILVVTPEAPADEVLDALRHRRDRHSFRLAPPVRVLPAPSNDGDGAMFAAPAAAFLAGALTRTEHALVAAGFPVSYREQGVARRLAPAGWRPR